MQNFFGIKFGFVINETVHLAAVVAAENKVVLAMYSYTANPKSNGGFTELSLEKGMVYDSPCE